MLLIKNIFRQTLVESHSLLLNKNPSGPIPDTSLTVVIPTYNEDENIEGCIKSIINSAQPAKEWSIVISDDSSSDKTIEILKKTISNLKEKQFLFKIINAGERPNNKNWVGKNWPCHVASKSSNSSWLLFLDADLRVGKYAIRDALNEAIQRNSDLLSLAPKIECKCLSEWLVQPIIGLLLPIGFPIKHINDSNKNIAFAAGPFMLFRESAYHSIGGHESVATEVVEDIALAKKIKRDGYKLNFILGVNAISLRMYKDFKALWEGWSKNWFIGLRRNIFKLISASILILLMFTFPWVLILISSIKILLVPNQAPGLIISLVLSIFCIIHLYLLRLEMKTRFGIKTKYWWLSGFGGLIIAAIGPVSLVKTITGVGWTWKGRKLSGKK